MEPITEIPAHIRILPESEQGPALVKAIHDRKANVSRETGMDLDLDSHAGYFEQLRQMMIFGETWVNPDDNTIRYRPDEHPWDVLRPASGKSWTVQWLDEMAQAQAAEEERATVLRDVAARGLTPPKADDTPVTVRWACDKPTDSPSYVLDNTLYRAPMQSVEPGFGDLLRRWLQMR